MRAYHVTAGMICTVAFGAACGVWAAMLAPPRLASDDFNDFAPYHEVPATGRAIDRYGNPVAPALGDYRVDPDGELYEQHAPDTAITRLPPPEA